MKNQILLIVLLLISSFSSIAQLNEGHLKYTIDFKANSPEMEMAVSMFVGSTLEVFFKGNKSKSIMQMGPMMKITTIANTSTHEQLIFMDGMIGKKVIKSTTESEENSNEKPEMEVSLTNETKKILGYLCKKAILHDADGNTFEFWYNEEIKMDTKGHKYLNLGVPGFPMEFTISQGGMIMKMTLSAIEEKLNEKDKSLFSMDIPDGYEELTTEELMMMGM